LQSHIYAHMERVQLKVRCPGCSLDLARDAGVLVEQAGYRCVSAGVVNMFPHTAHVESMAVFERD